MFCTVDSVLCSISSMIYTIFVDQEVKIFTPDYTNIDPDKAIEDFKERIKHYETIYEPLEDKVGGEG